MTYCVYISTYQTADQTVDLKVILQLHYQIVNLIQITSYNGLLMFDNVCSLIHIRVLWDVKLWLLTNVHNNEPAGAGLINYFAIECPLVATS